MTEHEKGMLIIKSRGVLDFYYSTNCAIEKSGDVDIVSFSNMSLNPPNMLMLSASPKTFSVLNRGQYDDDGNLENELNYIDFNTEGGAPILSLDFHLFTLVLFKAGAVYRVEENSKIMEFKGFIAKDDKKTEQVLFIIEIRTV